jgi:ribosome-associated heat shock protein Hsp15
LWAARFYKTRSLAITAIKTGKVLLGSERIKPSREISAGDILVIKQGVYSKTVQVLGLSSKRGPASVAQTLYRETEQSVAQREHMQQVLKAQPGIRRPGEGRPTKKERRQIIQFTDKPI